VINWGSSHLAVSNQSPNGPKKKKKATSSAIRRILREHPKLKERLRTMDGMRGLAREEALEESVGISRRGELGEVAGDDDDGMVELAEAIEGAVRGNRDEGLLGLDWSTELPELE
jgi:hypothetical protein